MIFLQLLVTALSLSVMVLLRRKHWAGWALSIAQQIPLALINWHLGLYFFYPLQVVYLVNAAAGFYQWGRAAKWRP
jgi:hypothetical protein